MTLALVARDQLARPRDLASVTGVEEQQVLGQRHHLERVLARAGGEQQPPLGVDDVAVEREARIEVEGARRLGARAGPRTGCGLLHGLDAAGPGLLLRRLQFAAAFLVAQALLDEVQQVRLGDAVGRARCVPRSRPAPAQRRRAGPSRVRRKRLTDAESSRSLAVQAGDRWRQGLQGGACRAGGSPGSSPSAPDRRRLRPWPGAVRRWQGRPQRCGRPAGRPRRRRRPPARSGPAGRGSRPSACRRPPIGACGAWHAPHAGATPGSTAAAELQGGRVSACSSTSPQNSGTTVPSTCSARTRPLAR